MRVEPHPHIGLQTVTWPLVGEIRHRDTIDSDVVLRRGQLNLMTAGHGIAHSEYSVGEEAGRSTRCSSGWCCPTAPPPVRPASSST
jgi:redox-sensitive bicupin YhaK (pirin superfamily)